MMIRFYLKLLWYFKLVYDLWLSMVKIETDCQLRKKLENNVWEYFVLISYL